MELVFDTWGIRDGVTVELVKKEEEGTTVELVKIETDVMFTEEWTELIDVTERKWDVVLLVVSTDLEEVAIKLLLDNPLEVETNVDCTMELVFETCGIRDGMRVELEKIDADGLRVELVKIVADVVFAEE